MGQQKAFLGREFQSLAVPGNHAIITITIRPPSGIGKWNQLSSNEHLP